MTVLSVRLDAELEELIIILMEKRKIVDKPAYVRQLLDRSTKESSKNGPNLLKGNVK